MKTKIIKEMSYRIELIDKRLHNTEQLSWEPI